MGQDDDKKPPAGTQGQDDPSPADQDKVKGKEDDSPAGAQGKGDVDLEALKKKADSYDNLRSEFDKKTGQLGRITEEAKKYGYDEGEEEQFLQDLQTELGKAQPPDQGAEGKPKGEDKKPPEEDFKGAFNVAAQLSIAARKDAQWEGFIRKNPDVDESLRSELDKEVDQLMKENPRVLKSGNWYAKAMRNQLLQGEDFLAKVKKSAVKEEEERKGKLNDLESATGGAKPSGKGETLEKELQERFG